MEEDAQDLVARRLKLASVLAIVSAPAAFAGSGLFSDWSWPGCEYILLVMPAVLVAVVSGLLRSAHQKGAGAVGFTIVAGFSLVVLDGLGQADLYDGPSQLLGAMLAMFVMPVVALVFGVVGLTTARGLSRPATEAKSAPPPPADLAAALPVADDPTPTSTQQVAPTSPALPRWVQVLWIAAIVAPVLVALVAITAEKPLDEIAALWLVQVPMLSIAILSGLLLSVGQRAMGFIGLGLAGTVWLIALYGMLQGEAGVIVYQIVGTYVLPFVVAVFGGVGLAAARSSSRQ